MHKIYLKLDAQDVLITVLFLPPEFNSCKK